MTKVYIIFTMTDANLPEFIGVAPSKAIATTKILSAIKAATGQTPKKSELYTPKSKDVKKGTKAKIGVSEADGHLFTDSDDTQYFAVQKTLFAQQTAEEDDVEEEADDVEAESGSEDEDEGEVAPAPKAKAIKSGGAPANKALYHYKKVTLSIGMRIEGFDVTNLFFSNKSDALEHAFAEANKWALSRNRNPFKKNPSGKYEIMDSSYPEWPQFQSSVVPISLNMNDKIVCNFKTSF